MKRKIILPTMLAVAILSVGILSASKVSAQELTGYPVIVERLAEKFNLNKDEVKSVFEEVRDEHHADMYSEWVEKLDQLVADGKLTADQKNALLAKYEEMHDKRLDFINLDPEQRKEEMQKLHSELKVWADENGFDLSLVGPFAGQKHGMMMRGHLN